MPDTDTDRYTIHTHYLLATYSLQVKKHLETFNLKLITSVLVSENYCQELSSLSLFYYYLM